MPIPRRKKPFTFDGAEVILSPMTYNELDEYGVRRKETGEKIEALKLPAGALFSDYPEELRKEMRNNALFVVRCGMNNAGIDPPVTEESLQAEMDDILAGLIAAEVFRLNGFKVPTPEEADRLAKASTKGESQASS